MNVIIRYNELSELINNMVGIHPEFTTVDAKVFEMSCKTGIFMPTIVIKFHIETVCKDIVCISYECSVSASLMIVSVVAYLKEKIPSGIEVNTTDKRVNIYPRRFKQIEKVLAYVSLSNITFEENSAKVALTMA